MPMELRQRLSRVIDSFPRDVRDKQGNKREALSKRQGFPYIGGPFMYERKVQRGDIYYAKLGKTKGSVQGKSRPVVVLQNNTGNKHSPTLIVATITSKTKKKRSLPTHVIFRVDKLPLQSVVQLEQITTIDKKQLVRFVCVMPEDIMRRIDVAIQTSLSLPTEDFYSSE